MRKLLSVIIIFLILTGITILFVFFPPKQFFEEIPVVDRLLNNTSLIITSNRNKASIMIDGKDYGETNQTINDLPEGIYNVELERIVGEATTTNTFYKPFSFSVELKNNTESIANIEIGPAGLVSGYILFYSDSPSTSDNEGFITVNSTPDGAKVFYGEELLGNAPIRMKKLESGNTSLRIEAVGYETIEIPIVVRSGYNLNINPFLLPVPTNVTSQ